MNFTKILVLSFLSATSFLSYGMETKPSQEDINAANLKLILAVWMGNIAKVKKLITKNVADLNAKLLGSPLLISASRKAAGNADRAEHADSIECVRTLIEAGADINIKMDSTGNTVLMDVICYRNIEIVNILVNAGADVNMVNKDGRSALALAVIYYRHPSNNKHSEICMTLINPPAKPAIRKKIETLIMIYNEGHSCLSELPKELLKVIITYAHPEYAMDRESVRCLHPQVLVDTIPLEALVMLIKDGILNQDAILGAWQNKITSMVQSLKARKMLDDNAIRKFESDALTKVTMSLTFEESW